MHRPGSDLNLQRFASGAENHGVQRLISVGFRLCDVIVKLFGKNFARTLNKRQRLIALFHGVHDDSHRTDVKELLEFQIFLYHLLPDGIDVLWASRNGSLDAVGGEKILNASDCILNRSDTFFARFLKRVRNGMEDFRFGKAQR